MPRSSMAARPSTDIVDGAPPNGTDACALMAAIRYARWLRYSGTSVLLLGVDRRHRSAHLLRVVDRLAVALAAAGVFADIHDLGPDRIGNVFRLQQLQRVVGETDLIRMRGEPICLHVRDHGAIGR